MSTGKNNHVQMWSRFHIRLPGRFIGGWLCLFFVGGWFQMADSLGFCRSASAGESGNKGIVVILNSYHPGYAWSDNEQLGVIETLRERDINWQPHVAYMDMMRSPSGQHLRYFTEIMRAKYRDRKFSAVIAMDNSAFEYALDNQEGLFRKAPIVFCGVNYYKPSMLRSHPNVTGMVENIDQTGTIEAMLKIHPETREILVLHDYTVTELANKKEMEDLIPRLSGRIRVRFIKNLPVAEIMEELKHLKKGSLVLMKAFSTDRDGSVSGVEEITELVCRNSPVPVYGRQIARLGYGIIGGKMLDGRIHGRNAAHLALRVLAGEEAADIPVNTKSDALFMFDYKVMKRFGIPLSALPDNSIVINKPGSIFDEHLEVILTAAAVIFLLCLIIALFMSHTLRLRKAQETLRQSQDKYRELVENLSDGIYSLDTMGKILYVSPVLERILGYRSEDVIKRHFSEFVHPDDLSSLTSAFQDVLKGNLYTNEVRLIGKSGEIFWVRTSNRPLMQDGRVSIITGTLTDITERKRMERSIAENEARLRTLVQTIPDLIWLKDVDGVYLVCNKRVELFFGARDADIIGKTDYDFIDRELADSFREHDCKAMTAGKPSANEEWLTFADDGYQGLFDTIKTPMYDAEGKLTGVLGISRDITKRKQAEEERKNLEERLQQSCKMEAIGTLAGGIAHDFNNILSAVLGFAELAKMKLEDRKYIEKALGEILKAGIRARDLVKQILTFSRQTGIKREPMELVPLIKETMKFLRASLPVTIDINQNLSVSDSMIIADPIQIHQVIMNLSTNAAYAMKEKGGMLDIRLAEVELADEAELDFKGLKRGRYLQLTVADTGSGIPKEIINRIFDPFFTTKERGEGTGMGLSVVHGIVKDLGGAISVYSEPGNGTTFRALFPKYEGESLVVDSQNIATRTGSGRILFVDDEEGVIGSGRGILEQLGYKVVSTTNPLEALEIFRSRPDEFDLVLTDMTMHKMTGLELSEQLLKIRPDIPIVLCTGFSLGITAERIKDVGIKKLVMKPMIANELANAIYSVLKPVNA